jgi:hypothetical protein
MTGVVPRQPVAERGTIVSLVGQQFLYWRKISQTEAEKLGASCNSAVSQGVNVPRVNA